MKKIFVPDMHCDHCVKRISAALKDVGIEATVELATQTVTVCGDDQCLEKAKNEIYDIGFTPEYK